MASQMVSPENREVTEERDAQYSEVILKNYTSHQNQILISFSFTFFQFLDKAVWSHIRNHLQLFFCPMLPLCSNIFRPVLGLFIYHSHCTLWVLVSAIICLRNVTLNPCFSPHLLLIAAHWIFMKSHHFFEYLFTFCALTIFFLLCSISSSIFSTICNVCLVYVKNSFTKWGCSKNR